MAGWRVRVLGAATLENALSHALERKAAALLAYLALEGPTSRSRLAGLLWPESTERTARNNLAQLTRRLRALAGEPLVVGGDPVTLAAGVSVDAAEVKLHMFAGDTERVAAARGELLRTADYDDLPEFSDWLWAERERLGELRRGAHHAEAARLEAAGDLAAALGHAHALIAHDPVAEEAHRLAMRLHYVRGERAAALRAFERCRESLRRELGVGPLPETLELAREVEAGHVTPPEQSQPFIPLNILRPPTLVGREREWAQLEAAWQAGKLIVVSGPPGSGKTRLITDFVADKARVLRSEGRPGDAGVPFSSLTRSFRRFFTMMPELSLEPWIAQELGRLLPDLFPETPAAADPLRFHEAMVRAARLVADHAEAIVIDDYQFYDASSFEAGARATSHLIAEGLGSAQARTLVAFRSGEMPEAVLATLEELVAQGLALHIALGPLSPKATATMLESLGLSASASDADALSDELWRYTGGNPLFIVETLKTLLETRPPGARLPVGLPPGLPPSGRVSALIQARLSRLSARASHLGWVAAVARDDFSLELASAALEADAFALAAPCEELARAQIFAGGWFSHDLLFEASLAAIPALVKTLLHGRCARFLAAQGANPARVAQHFLDAGEAACAAPLLLKAADAAQATYQFAEAADFLERAADIYAEHDEEQAFGALLELGRLLMDAELGARLERTLARLEALAGTPTTRARALHLRAMRCAKLGHGAEAERAARRGLELIGEDGEPHLRSELLNELGTALFLGARLHEALAAFERTLELGAHPNKPNGVAATLSSIGVVLDHLERHREAALHHQRAAELLGDPRHGALRVSVLNNLSISQVEQGLVDASLQTLHTALELSGKLSGAEGAQFFTLSLLGACQADLARYREALGTLTRARALAERYASYAVGAMERHLARVYLELGQPARAGELLDAAAARDELPGSHRVGIWLARAEVLARTGGDPSAALETARHYAQTAERTALHARVLLAEALLLEPGLGLARAQEARTRLEESELGGLRIVAEARCAQLSLAHGNAHAALEHLAEVAALQTRYQPSDFYLGELHLTRYRTLVALGDENAQTALEEARRWVERAAETCPSAYRTSFLEDNPVNRAILSG